MMNVRDRMAVAGLSVALLIGVGTARAAHPGSLEVDARDAPRGITRVHLVLPVDPGKLTLLYPKWLPGEHAPNGPIGGLAGLRFSANGHALPWQRDADNMFAFHLSVPPGSDALDVEFEVDAVTDAGDHNALRLSTESLAIVLWNQLLFYPAGVRSDELSLTASLRLPTGWQFGTALPVTSTVGDIVKFAPVSLTTLVDSPVIAGRYFRTVELGADPAVSLDIVADSAAALGITAETTAQLRRLIRETTMLFGAIHYDNYHFLLSLSDRIAYEGIEHHQSSDNRLAERALIDEDMRRSADMTTLLPHEYVHSWNGKYRRPVGLATGNYDAPMRGELLWIYEGLTEYLGLVLSARSGLASPADSRDTWADIAAWLETRKGRDWRPLEDTAIAAQIGYTQASGWQARTRGTDFYRESALLWLEADTLIRTKTHGARSLDDFCRSFYGPPNSSPKVVPYDLDDVLKALTAVLPYDWRGFWSERLNRVSATAPLDGLTTAGWRLAFGADASPEQKGETAISKETNFDYSLGFSLKEDGAVIEYVLPGSPADVAGIAPDSMLIAVNGRKFSKDVLDDALKEDGAERSVRLLIEKDELFSTRELRYAGESRYPTLERDAATPDLLTVISTARTP